MNSEHVSRAVDLFIESKVMDLVRRKQYDEELQCFVESYLKRVADGTFLWVALVCKALRDLKVKTFKTQEILEKFPPSLPDLYSRLMEQIPEQNDKDNAKFCH